jgi:hypothetical protein
VEYYRALGVVFEEYVKELLVELAELSGATFVPPFKYARGKESPDGFIRLGQGPWHSFEAKCYRVPQSAYEEMRVTEFEKWFKNLLGANDGKRPALRQGSAFFDAWKQGDVDITSRLGVDGFDGAHIIISHEDVPVFSNWRVFRKWFSERHNVQAPEAALWTRTIIASVRDLEKLIAAGYAARTSGSAFDISLILSEYRRYMNDAPDVFPESRRVKNTIGDWILTRMPAAREHESARTREARDRLFAQAKRLGFGEEISSMT